MISRRSKFWWVASKVRIEIFFKTASCGKLIDAGRHQASPMMNYHDHFICWKIDTELMDRLEVNFD